MTKLIDMKGQRFGRLRVTSHFHKSTTSGSAMWNCRCDCGKKTVVQRGNLIRGFSKSCGCLRNEVTKKRKTTHGLNKNRVHRAWRRMLKRRVCDAWRSSFALFLSDMGNPPTPKHVLAIRDLNIEYSPSNCHWALRHELVKRALITYEGRTKTVVGWARELGMLPNCLKLRLRRGWTFKEAITLPVRGAGESVEYRV